MGSTQSLRVAVPPSTTRAATTTSQGGMRIRWAREIRLFTTHRHASRCFSLSSRAREQGPRFAFLDGMAGVCRDCGEALILNPLVPCSVNAYDHRTATLHLVSEYPRLLGSPQALVDISLVLARTCHETIQVGAWVNVIGYVPYPSRATQDHHLRVGFEVKIQALVLWSAESAVQPQQYNQAALARRAAQASMAHARNTYC